MSQFQVYVQRLPEEKCKQCTETCEPVFDSMGSTCGGCRDKYHGPTCQYPGITGWFGKNYCIKFDQDYGGCLECIGCKKDCDPVTACPFY